MTKKSKIFQCCRDCNEKFEACHDVCATYLKAQEEWRELQRTIKEAKYEHKLYENYHRERVIHQCKVNRNKNGR